MWVLEAGHANQPGLLWCGTIPGGLFRSDDAGATWHLVRSLWNHPSRKQWFGGGAEFPGIHSICIHPQDGRKLILGVSCGGVWHSADAGETWELHGQGLRAEYMPPELAQELVIQDPHRMVQSPTRPERVWVQHHNGIFRSDDGGRTFTEIKKMGPSGSRSLFTPPMQKLRGLSLQSKTKSAFPWMGGSASRAPGMAA